MVTVRAVFGLVDVPPSQKARDGLRKAGMESRLGQGESAILCCLEQGGHHGHFSDVQP